MRKIVLGIIFLVFSVCNTSLLQAEKEDYSQLYDYLRQIQETGNIEKNDITYKVPPSFQKYLDFLYKENKNTEILEENSGVIFFTRFLYNNKTIPFNLEKNKLNDMEKSFYFLKMAKEALKEKNASLAIKFFFQSFFLFINCKEKYAVTDKIIFLNEWYYHFYREIPVLNQIELNQEISEYYASILLNSCNFLYYIPSFFFVHPDFEIDFINQYIKIVSEKILEIDKNYAITEMKEFKNSTFKMFLINSSLYITEKNYLKADIFLDKTLSFFENNPIPEDMFVIYKETLKNKILISIQISTLEQSIIFLKKYLSYSQLIDNLRENWLELKEYISSEKKGKQFIQHDKVKQILSDFKIS